MKHTKNTQRLKMTANIIVWYSNNLARLTSPYRITCQNCQLKDILLPKVIISWHTTHRILFKKYSAHKFLNIYL